MNERKRYIVIDDHPAVRIALKATLPVSDFELVGEGGSISDGKRLLAKGDVDLMITDLTFQDGEGDDFIRECREKAPDLKIIAFSMHQLAKTIRRTIAAGADAYFCKLDDLDWLHIGVAEVFSGGVYFSPSALRELKTTSSESIELRDTGIPGLSPTEGKIFNCLSWGFSRKEIAEQYSMGLETAETHLRRMAEKLGFKNRRELIRFAINRRNDSWQGK